MGHKLLNITEIIFYSNIIVKSMNDTSSVYLIVYNYLKKCKLKKNNNNVASCWPILPSKGIESTNCFVSFKR